MAQCPHCRAEMLHGYFLIGSSIQFCESREWLDFLIDQPANADHERMHEINRQHPLVLVTGGYKNKRDEWPKEGDYCRTCRTVCLSAAPVLKTDHIAPILDQLARGPALVRELIYEVSPELRKRRPAPGVWSAHEHAVHLPVVQPIMIGRLKQMLTDPSRPIKSYEPSRDDPDDALLKLDLEAEMDRFARERIGMVTALKTLTPDQWEISVEHEEYFHYSVRIMFRHLALHDLYHAYRIEERLLRKHWE